MKRFHITLVILTAVLLWACGEATVEVNNDNYEPKIVMEGYLYPGQPVQNIKINRNIPLNTIINRSDLTLNDATVKLTDLQDSQMYALEFDQQDSSFAYKGNDLEIAHGGSYRLSVNAVIDGKELTAVSTTTVPAAGFTLLEDQSTQSIGYHEFAANFQLKKPTMFFQRSPGTDFYAFSILSLDASLDSFIFPPTNPYIPSKWKREDVEENFYDLVYSSDEVFNAQLSAGTMSREFEWWNIMFYGRYRVIGYAGDQNMKDYYLSFRNVTEMDGNLHEPVFHIEGDGIGVFASAIRDTLYFDVTNLTD